jgi:hypothetical protein
VVSPNFIVDLPFTFRNPPGDPIPLSLGQEAKMQFLTRLGFRIGHDEEARHASGQAVRLSWGSVMVLLLIWSIYDVARTGTLPGEFLVLAVGLFVFGVVQLYVQRNVSGIRD